MVTTSLFSVAAAKIALTKSAAEAEAATNKTLGEQGTSTQQVSRARGEQLDVVSCLYLLQYY